MWVVFLFPRWPWRFFTARGHDLELRKSGNIALQATCVASKRSSYMAFTVWPTADSNALVQFKVTRINIWIAPEGEADRASAVTARKNVQEGHYNLAWTSDGRVVFDSNANAKASIWIVSADGSNPKALTDNSADDYAPEVLPDGRFIIFNSNRTGNPQAFRTSIDGGETQQLTNGVGGVATFSISPDGKWMLYNPFTVGFENFRSKGALKRKSWPKVICVILRCRRMGNCLPTFLMTKKRTARRSP